VRTGEIALERTDAGVAVLTISGEHDLSTAPGLGTRLRRLTGDSSPIVVDLSGATFIDSSILGAILDARRRAGSGRFAVVNAGDAEAVRRVLEVTGLQTALPVHELRDQALVAVTKGEGAGTP
jgi:anti-sigma B factor antagonist